MEDLQISFHDVLDARHSAGWEYQLKDELAFNLNYMHKHYLEFSKFKGVESTLVPYLGAELGNVSTKASIPPENSWRASSSSKINLEFCLLCNFFFITTPILTSCLNAEFCCLGYFF